MRPWLMPVLAAVASLAAAAASPVGAQQPASTPTAPMQPMAGKPAAPTTHPPTDGAQLPADTTAANDVVLKNADHLHVDENNVATAEGNVQIGYRNYTLSCDKVVIDTDAEVAVLTGHIKLNTQDKSVEAAGADKKSRLILDLRRGTYNVIDGSAVVAPSQVPEVQGLLLPLRLYGGSIDSMPRVIDARGTSITTCDFANPHYVFVAQKATIIPGKRLIARNVTLYRRKRKIITIPFVIFPLSDRYQRGGITPIVGESADEGYFIKFANPYALSDDAVGLLRLDLMSRKGAGYGFQQSFVTGHDNPPAHSTVSIPQSAGMPGSGSATGSSSFSGPTVGGAAAGVAALAAPATAGNTIDLETLQSGIPGQAGGLGNPREQGGTVSFYTLNDHSTGLNSSTGSLADSQTLFGDLHLKVDSQFQNNSYLASATASNAVNSNISLALIVPHASTTFTTNLQQSSYGVGQSRTVTTSLDQEQVLSKTSSFSFKVNTSQFISPGFDGLAGNGQQTLATNFDYVSHPTGYALELLTNTFNGTSTGTGALVSGGVQRLPELRLATVPSPKMELLPRLLPALSRLLLSLGEFKETTTGSSKPRGEFGLDLGTTSTKHAADTVTYSGEFLQDVYGADAARYTLQTQVGEQYAFQQKSYLSVTYAYLRPYGYTPFLFDQSGSYNNSVLTLNYMPSSRYLLTAGTGYDFNEDRAMNGLPAVPYQNLTTQFTYTEGKQIQNILSGDFDPNHGLLFDTSDNLSIALLSGIIADASARYVPTVGRFSNLDGDLTLPIILDKREQSGYRIQAIAGYNGYSSKILYKGLSLTRIWHDWELSGIYQENTEDETSPGATFYLNFRLKAFPAYQPFGVGQFGQSLSTGIGQVL